jgi:ankyrin repeat protein
MKQLINKNPWNYDGVTPLNLAAEEGHFQICKLILDKVLDKSHIIIRDNNEQTPLHFAAKEGHGEICKLLLDNVEDKNPVDSFGDTPNKLYLAASNEVEELFDSNAKGCSVGTFIISFYLIWTILWILAPYI